MLKIDYCELCDYERHECHCCAYCAVPECGEECMEEE